MSIWHKVKGEEIYFDRYKKEIDILAGTIEDIRLYVIIPIKLMKRKIKEFEEEE
jgi:hypothetical protein